MKIRKAMARFDGWLNSLTLLGTASDKTQSTSYAAGRSTTYDEIRALYDGDWLAQRVVDALPNLALRRGFEAPNAEVALKKFREIDHARHSAGALRMALKFGRLEGGCALLLGVKGATERDKPISEGAELQWLDIVRRDQVRVLEKDTDPNSASFGEPVKIQIHNGHKRSGLVVDASRFLWCEGRDLATGEDQGNWISDLVTNSGLPNWGSVLQPTYTTISRYGMSWNAVSTMLTEASIAVFKMKGLTAMLSAHNQEEIENRFNLMNVSRSVARMIALDSEGDESYERKAVAFTDIPSLLSSVMQDVSGAAQIPAVVLFGISPGGMNATGQSDLQQWYDQGEEYRRNNVTPKAMRLLRLCGAHENMEIEYPAMWEPTALELEEQYLKRAQSEQIYWTMEALHESEVRKLRGEEQFGLTSQEASTPLTNETEPEPDNEPEPVNELDNELE